MSPLSFSFLVLQFHLVLRDRRAVALSHFSMHDAFDFEHKMLYFGVFVFVFVFVHSHLCFFLLDFGGLGSLEGLGGGRRCLIYQCTVALTLNSSADHYSPSRHAAVQPVSHKSTNSLRTKWQI